jgi:hypothetical protein
LAPPGVTTLGGAELTVSSVLGFCVPLSRTGNIGPNFGTPVEAQIIAHRQLVVQSFNLDVDALAGALLG